MFKKLLGSIFTKSVNHPAKYRAVARKLKKVTRKDWIQVKRSDESAILRMTRPLIKMDDAHYKDFMRKLKYISENFFVDNGNIIHCRIRSDKADRFLKLLDEKEHQLLSVINDGLVGE